MPEGPLRVGIFCDGTSLPRWEADILTSLEECDEVQIVLFLLGSSTPSTLWETLRVRWREGPYLLANRAEAFILRHYFRAWLRTENRIDCFSSFESCDRLEVDLVGDNKKLNHRLNERDIEKIGDYSLDVLLVFGSKILSGRVLESAKFGAWSFQHADSRKYCHTPASFWEVYRKEPYTGVTLLQLTGDLNDAREITNGYYSTHQLSWNRNRQVIYEKSKTIMLDALRELASTRRLNLKKGSVWDVYDKPLSRMPNVWEASLAIVKIAFRRMAESMEGFFFREYWEILIHEGSSQGVPVQHMRRLTPPEDRFWADPFVIEKDGDQFIFFEDFVFPKDKGIISMLHLRDSEIAAYETVIECPYHLSFPFLFEYKNDLFMIPESSENRAVELWKCVDFPLEWEKDREILSDVSAADSVVFCHEKRWWLFTNINQSKLSDHCNELWAFHSSDPLSGKWIGHTRNPIVRDARCARNAGPIRQIPGIGLVRMGQQQGYRYGSGLQIMRIERLTVDEYEETIFDEIRPTWSRRVVGVHHLDWQETISVFDALRRERRFL